MGRRRFVTVALSMGITAESLRLGTRDDIVQAADDDEIPYVRYLEGGPADPSGRQPIYDTIPREEWIRRRTALNVRTKVERIVSREWGASPITPAFVAMETSPTGFGVEVEYPVITGQNETTRGPEPSFDEVREMLPEKAEGTMGEGKHRATRESIPVRVVRTESTKLACDDTQDQSETYTYTDVPGGVPIAVLQDDGDHTGAIAAPFNHNDLGKGWTTAGHLGPTGDWMYQPDSFSGPDIAMVEDKVDPFAYPLKDAAFGTDYSSANPYRKIANEKADGGYDYYLKGIVTETTLDNDVGTDEVYYSQGTYSGRIGDTLLKTTTWGVVSEHDTSKGDSGGPLFSVSSNDAFIAGQIVRGRQNGLDEDDDGCYDDLGSMKAVKVEDALNGHYMTTSDTP